MTDLLSTRREILALLNDNGIPYELHEHERAFTIDDCLRMPFIGPDVTICKNILLCNRQKTRFYLMLLKPLTPFRTAVVSKALGGVAPELCPGGGAGGAPASDQREREPAGPVV